MALNLKKKVKTTWIVPRGLFSPIALIAGSELRLILWWQVSFIPCGTFESPCLGKAAAVVRAELPLFTVRRVFSCQNKGMAAKAWDLQEAHRC